MQEKGKPGLPFCRLCRKKQHRCFSELPKKAAPLLLKLERAKSLELSTSTLARLRSTN
jgi:hypothetical protein